MSYSAPPPPGQGGRSRLRRPVRRRLRRSRRPTRRRSGRWSLGILGLVCCGLVAGIAGDRSSATCAKKEIDAVRRRADRRGHGPGRLRPRHHRARAGASIVLRRCSPTRLTRPSSSTSPVAGVRARASAPDGRLRTHREHQRATTRNATASRTTCRRAPTRRTPAAPAVQRPYAPPQHASERDQRRHEQQVARRGGGDVAVGEVVDRAQAAAARAVGAGQQQPRAVAPAAAAVRVAQVQQHARGRARPPASSSGPLQPLPAAAGVGRGGSVAVMAAQWRARSAARRRGPSSA